MVRDAVDVDQRGRGKGAGRDGEPEPGRHLGVEPYSALGQGDAVCAYGIAGCDLGQSVGHQVEDATGHRTLFAAARITLRGGSRGSSPCGRCRDRGRFVGQRGQLTGELPAQEPGPPSRPPRQLLGLPEVPEPCGDQGRQAQVGVAPPV